MTTATLPAAPWADPKRWLWLLSPAIPVLCLGFLLAAWQTGNFAWAWAMPAVFYLIIPALDWWFGTDESNPPDTAVAGLEADRYYRAVVYAYVPTQYLVTALAAWLACTAEPRGWELIGLAMSAGIINGVGINTAHELGHKTQGLDRWLAKLTLGPVAYGHFFVEHNKGHHKNVATPEDPASSRMGESFWAFLPRTMVGSLRSAWGIERERLARLGKPVWHWQNENLQAWAITGVFFAALTAWLGWIALPFLLAQAFFGASLLEVVNYLEHYGLVRQKGADGRYERCQPRHSWNSNHIVTNLVLYQLQRHSDHHAHPTRSFQALRHFEESPQLPSGYASLIVVAYFPRWWFWLMDKRVVAAHGGDLRRAHLHAPKREALLRRWQATAAITPAPLPAAAAPIAASAAAHSRRYQCSDCGYVYDEAQGCPHEGFAPGTPFAALPANWPCPDCAVREKPDFVPL